MTYPFPDNNLMYPAWWADAVTITVTIGGWVRTMPKENIQVFPYGLAFDSGADWSAAIQPWDTVTSLFQAS